MTSDAAPLPLMSEPLAALVYALAAEDLAAAVAAAVAYDRHAAGEAIAAAARACGYDYHDDVRGLDLAVEAAHRGDVARAVAEATRSVGYCPREGGEVLVALRALVDAAAAGLARCRYCSSLGDAATHRCAAVERPPPPAPRERLAVVRVPRVAPDVSRRAWNAAYDMRALARHQPRTTLRGAPLERSTSVAPHAHRPPVVGPTYAELEAEAIEARLADPRLGALWTPSERGVGPPLLVTHGPTCEVCNEPRGTPWKPPAPPPGENRAERRKRLRAARAAAPPGPPALVATLAGVLQFAFGYHADDMLGDVEVAPHVAWHFADHARRGRWRAMVSDALRDAELESFGRGILDAAVHVYEHLDDADDAEQTRRSLTELLTGSNPGASAR